MAYLFKRSITLDHTQVPSTQSSFAVLVKLDATNAGTTMKTVGNGGHIQNTGTQSGGNAVTMPFDLIFTSDSGGTTKIPWEVESYDGTNGVLWAWVFITSVSSSSDTVFYMFYDDASVNTQQNTSSLAPLNVWDSNYVLVAHLPDGTSLSAADSTSNNWTATLNNTPTATSGQIDGAANFVATSSQEIEYTSLGSTTIYQTITVSAWINYLLGNTYRAIFAHNNINGSIGYRLNNDGGTQQLDRQGQTAIGTSNTVVSAGVWHYVTVTYNGTTVKFYLDGAPDGSTNTTDAFTHSPNGIVSENISAYPNGKVDEFRYSKMVRSADWITTEYNNQNNPENFSVVGSETSASSTVNSNFFFLMT